MYMTYSSACITSLWARNSIPAGEQQTLLHGCSQCRPGDVCGRVSAPAVCMPGFHARKMLTTLTAIFGYSERFQREGPVR